MQLNTNKMHENYTGNNENAFDEIQENKKQKHPTENTRMVRLFLFLFIPIF